jgi:stringent starvation protein B
MRILVPMTALVAIYARENGVGMVFGHEPVLPVATTEAEEEDSHLASVDSTNSDDAEVDGEQTPKDKASPNKPHKKKPSLRVIK